MVAYFGAELNASEREHFAHLVAVHDPIQGHQDLGWGLDQDGNRTPLEAALIANTIGLLSVSRPPDVEDEQDGANGTQPQAQGNAGVEEPPIG